MTHGPANIKPSHSREPSSVPTVSGNIKFSSSSPRPPTTSPKPPTNLRPPLLPKSPTNFLVPVHFFSDETSRCLQLDTTVLVVSDSSPPPLRTTVSLWSPTALGTASRVQSSYTTLSARPSALGPTPKSRQRGVHTSGKW